MADARERLTRLIALASETSPENQRALAFELCDLLTDWPPRYPAAMREPFEALLEKVLRRLDGTTRRMIAARLAAQSDTALALLNQFYLDLPAEARASILARNAEDGGVLPEAASAGDEASLIAAARRTRGAEFARAFGHVLHISGDLAQGILDDASGDGLAVACLGGGISRLTFSTLALLALPDMRTQPGLRHERLSLFDTISQTAAARLLAAWRKSGEDGVDVEAA